MARPGSLVLAQAQNLLPSWPRSTVSGDWAVVPGPTSSRCAGRQGGYSHRLPARCAVCRFWLIARRRSVAGDCYAGFLYHQHLRGLQRHRTVQHPARNRECHTGSQLDGVATLEFYAQATVDDVEELVLLLVLVPVVFATREDAQAEQNAANLDQGLVVPGVVRPRDRFAYIDELKRAEQRLVVDPVVSLLRHRPHCIWGYQLRGGHRRVARDKSRPGRIDRLVHLFSRICLSRPGMAPGHRARGWFRAAGAAPGPGPLRSGPGRCPRTESPAMHRQRSRTPPRRTPA